MPLHLCVESKQNQQVQIDIGVGDYVTPGPQEITYPTILLELEAPKLVAYSIETLVAEKFHAMIELGSFNSRLKDFYDIHQFINLCNSEILKEAIKNTFLTRKTDWVKSPIIFKEAFYSDAIRLKQWDIFLSKNHLKQVNFREVGRRILKNLHPVYENLFTTLN